jgi:hypothetical protein
MVHASFGRLPNLLATERGQIEEMIGRDCHLPATALGRVSVEDGVAVPQETTETRQLKMPFPLEPISGACLFVLLLGPISVFERRHLFV